MQKLLSAIWVAMLVAGMTDTSSSQGLINPVDNPAEDVIWLGGLRARLAL